MLKELWLTWILVSGLRENATTNAQDTINLTAVIDGYTVNSTLTSPATLPLGRTALLVCRVSGIPHGQQTSYQWTCPNQPCLQIGYAGIKINNNIIAINTTSTSDGGTYICTVTAGGMNSTQDFKISVTGGDVVHSFGRLIPSEGFISTASQLQLPNTASGDGRIECTVSSGTADFGYTRNDVHNGTTATFNIPAGNFTNFQNREGLCGSIYHHLFISRNTLSPDLVLRNGTLNDMLFLSLDSTELMNNGITRVIVGYDRLDLGLPMVGQYKNNQHKNNQQKNNQHLSAATFTSLVPGARYRITVWGTTTVTGQMTARELRSTGPTVVEINTAPSVPSPPRALTITRVFEDGIELNWLPPRETNGDIQHYIIRYTLQNGTAQEITTTDNTSYYNLTELEGGQTYYSFTVKAVNLAHMISAQSNTIGSYTLMHSFLMPTSISTSEPSPAPSTQIPGQVLIDSSTAIVIGATTANLLILLLSITLLVISGVLIVKSRKRHTSTLHSTSQVTFDKESKDPAVQIYDEIDDSAKTTSKHTGVYQDLNINNMDTSAQYSTTKM